MNAPSSLAHRPPPTRTADVRTWQTVVALAHAFLCRGDGPYRVDVDEPWVLALIRVAAELLESQGYGRPRGDFDPAWERFVIDVARKPSTSEDGCVAMRSGRVPLASIPRGV